MAGLVTSIVLGALTAAVMLSPVRRRFRNQVLLKRAVFMVVAADILAALFFAAGMRAARVSEIGREGDPGVQTVKQLQIEIEGVLRDQTYDVEVSGRNYTREEEARYVAACKKELPEAVLGTKQKAKHVTQDLSLPEHIAGNPTQIRWSQDDYSVIDSNGRIDRSAVAKEGSRIVLTAVLTCGSTEDEWQMSVTVFPRKEGTTDGYLDEIARLLKEADAKDPTAKSMRLPDTVGDKKLVWKKENGRGGYFLIILGLAAAAFLYAQENEKENRKKQWRAKLMEEDYPQILNLFSMLLRAGLTPGHIWRLIVMDYEEEKNTRGIRPAFEAMAGELRKMQAGLSQEEAYLDFGSACEDARYEKFGNMLARHLRRGSSGLADELADEARTAYQEQKRTVQERGEQAQTKLLLPMMLLLMIVLLMVMVPAFLSMQM